MSKSKPPARQNSQTKIQSFTSRTTELHVGPLPHPDSLAKYNDIIPDGANRIMTMAEKQQDHRLELEKNAIQAQISQSARGQIFGFCICLIGLGISAWLAANGRELAGGILGGGGLLGLVSVFVIGKKRQKKDLDEKNSA